MMRILTNRWVHFTLLSMFVIIAAVFAVSDNSLRQEVQFYVFDQLNKMHPREKTDQILILDIDDDSLEKLGQWPWPRTILADIVTNLKSYGAKAIVFDGVLAEEDRYSPQKFLESLPDGARFSQIKQELETLSDNDMVLAEAIKNTGIFVSGFTYSTYSQNPGKPKLIKEVFAKSSIKKTFLENAHPFENAAKFIDVLEEVSAGNGSFMAIPDSDGVLRRAGMVFTDTKQLYPALSLEAVRVGYLRKSENIKIGLTPDDEKEFLGPDYKIVMGNYKVPVNKDGKIWVYYRHFEQAGKDYLSAYKALNDNDPAVRSALEGKIVFIASSAEGLKDLRNTAIQSFRPGVEIHANITEQILQGVFLKRSDLSLVVEGLFILVVGTLLVLMVPFVHVIITALLSTMIIAAAFATSYYGYHDYRILIDPVYPSACIFLIFVASTIFTYLRTEYERGAIRDAFGFYISPEYMKELTENPDKLKLGGENRDLSVMFTDIRNFTSISEGLTPEELIQLMNDFLTPMSDLVMHNKGTIDKYMGDAMMAFWNAPLDDPDHARHACMTALGMQEALEPINEEVERKAKELGKDPVLLKAGIGINTGECAVGNMGSKQRFAYSTLGDAVNVASRLEGQTKNYGVSILIGEKTYEDVKDFATLEADLIRVKGKTKPERIFVLLGNETEAQKLSFQKLKRNHDEMLALYRAKKFDEAHDLINKCREIEEYGLADLYEIYSDRATKYMFEEPGDDWDGVYTAVTK